MPTRSEQFEETRARLVEVGTRLFAGGGYAGVSTQEIVSACGMTRGALYHHFPSGKEGLFKAVHRSLQSTLMKRVAGACDKAGADLRHCLKAYFKAAADPAYRQVVLIDGPTLLSVEEWNDEERRVALDVIGTMLLRTGVSQPDTPAKAALLADILFAAFGQAALTIASSDDPARTTEDALDLFSDLLAGGTA